MLDFPFRESSQITSVYCFFMYVITLCIGLKPCLIQQRRISYERKRIILFLFFFFCITHAMKGDFFHYMEYVYGIKSETAIKEEFYLGVAKFVGRNYFLFRCVVFGGACALLCIIFNRCKLNLTYTIFFFFASYMCTFGYARASLGMVVYYLGLSFLCMSNKSNRLICYVLGIFLILNSTVFHNSMLILIIITPLIFIPLNKWTIAISLLLLPIVVRFFSQYFELILISDDYIEDEILLDKLLNYSDNTNYIGIANQLMNIPKYASFYVPLIICAKAIYNKNYNRIINNGIKRIYTVAFAVVYAATTFFFSGNTMYTFFYRIIFMSMIPITIVVCYLFYNGFLSKKEFVLCFVFGISYNLFRYTYQIYLL